jgi:hypothetical protein
MGEKHMNESAFPWQIDDGETMRGHKGMTLRDYFAAKAMTGLLTAEIVGEYTNEHIANISFLIADAMMKEREL